MVGGGGEGTVLVLVVKYLRSAKLKKVGFFPPNVEFLSVVWISKSGLEFAKKIFDQKSPFLHNLQLYHDSGEHQGGNGEPLPEKGRDPRTRSINYGL